MNSDKFPVNFIKSTFPPLKAFQNRQLLSWPQMVFVFLEMTFAMLLPVYNHYQNVEVFSIEDFYPYVVEMIDNQTLEEFESVDLNQGMLTLSNPFTIEYDQGIIAGNITTKDYSEYEDFPNILLFRSHDFIIRDEAGDERLIPYSEQSTLNPQDKNGFVQALSQMYTAQYRSEMIFTLTIVVYGFIFLFSLFIVFLYAYLIKSMKDFSMSSIVTYKEAVNFILNLIVFPTIIAVLFGFIRFNLILMMAIQVVSLIGLLIYVFRLTNFEDPS